MRDTKRSRFVDIDGDEVRRRRQDLGLTQRDLAEKTGLNASYISQIEASQRLGRQVSAPTLRRLSDALGATPGELRVREQEQVA